MKRFLLILVLTLPALTGFGKVHLPVPISDKMVLQRGEEIKIWGSADPSEKVRITFLEKKYDTKADGEGKWILSIPAQKPGGPYEMKINDTTLTGILIGDVYLCSGQSNMELPVRRVTDMFADEINNDENIYIRHLNVPLAYNFHAPTTDIGECSWKEMKKGEVSEFSALAYFFAKELYARTGVPVGIIRSAVGGSPVEAWMGEDALKPFPKWTAELRMCQNDEWVSSVRKSDNLMQRAWADALASISPDTCAVWKDMSLFSAKWATDGMNPIYGSHFFRRSVTLDATQASEDAVLRLGCIVDADSVFVNGTFVGTTSYQYPPRIYTVPAEVLKEGENEIEIHLYSYKDLAPCFVPDKPYKLITATGEISLLTGWQYRPGVRMPARPDTRFFQYEPAGLYNSMIAPLADYAVAGILWFQGESNVSRANEYASLLCAMITGWRAAMNSPELPFYIIELAAFLHPQDAAAQRDWAALRAQQKMASESLPDVYLIKNADCGEWNDIHALDKKTPAVRTVEQIMNTNK